MAKVATAIEQIIVPTFSVAGKWTWKDETNSLEFMSSNPNADRQDKRRRAKEGAKRDRIMSGMGNRALGSKKGKKKNRSPIRQPIKDHTFVNLEDIKTIANDILLDLEVSSESFESLFHTEQFDNFLLHLLSYFHCFFERMVQEQKLHTTTYIEPSLSEKQAHEDACARLEVCQRFLGQSYCVLVLGMGMEKQHHMACGESRVSSTYKDRSMYETLYTFCTFVVWITFRRKEFDVIKKEIGRMLRSDTFNPSLRVKFTEKQDKDSSKEELSSHTSIDKTTPAEYRRLHPKRPAIKSIVNQRSPAVVAILPSPKEEAHWLFRRKNPLAPGSLAKMSQVMDDSRQAEEDDLVDDLTINKKTFKIGILGEPLSQFNRLTLTPLGAENEEEDTDGSGDKVTTTEEEAEKPATKAERKISRQQTVTSHATTEAVVED